MPKRNPLSDNERMLIIITLNGAGEILQEAENRGEENSKLFEDLDAYIKNTTIDILEDIDIDEFLPKLTEFYRQFESSESNKVH